MRDLDASAVAKSPCRPWGDTPRGSQRRQTMGRRRPKRRRAIGLRRAALLSAFALAVVCLAGVMAPQPAAAYQPGAHYALVMNVEKNLPEGNIFKKAIHDYPTWAAWGSNGPDLPGMLFGQVIGRVPWFEATHYHKVGQYVRFLLQESVRDYEQHDRQAGYLKGIAFAAGYATHVAGDMAVHGILVNPECGICIGSTKAKKDLHHDLEGWADQYTWHLLADRPELLLPKPHWVVPGGPEWFYWRFRMDASGQGVTGQNLAAVLMDRANHEVVFTNGTGPDSERYTFLQDRKTFAVPLETIGIRLKTLHQKGDYWDPNNVYLSMKILRGVLEQNTAIFESVPDWLEIQVYKEVMKEARLYKGSAQSYDKLRSPGSDIRGYPLYTSRALRTVMAWNQANDLSLQLLTFAGQGDYSSGPWATSDAWEPDAALNDGRGMGTLQVTVETGTKEYGKRPGYSGRISLYLEFGDPIKKYECQLRLNGYANFRGGARDIYYAPYDAPYPISELTKLEIRHGYKKSRIGLRTWNCRQVSLGVNNQYVYVSDAADHPLPEVVRGVSKLVATRESTPGYDKALHTWSLKALDPALLADPSLHMPMAPYAGSSVSRGDWRAEFSSDCGPGLDMNPATVLPGTAQVPVRFLLLPGQHAGGAVTASWTSNNPVNLLRFHIVKDWDRSWAQLLVKVDGQTVADLTRRADGDVELAGLSGHTVQFVMQAMRTGRVPYFRWADISNIRVYSREDIVPPTTTVTGADDAWHATPVTLTFTATDDPGGSGVAYTEYQVNGGAWTRGTSLTVAAEGDNTVAYRSADVAGNVEAAKTCHVKIGSGDAAPPTTTVSGADDAWHNAAVTLTFSADDAGGSGVAYTEYAVNGGAWTRGTSATVSAEGDNAVDYRSADVAGNVEAAKTCHVRIDLTAPTSGFTTATPPAGTSGDTPYWYSSVTFSFTASDAGGSGADRIMLRWEKGTSAAGPWTIGGDWVAANLIAFASSTTGFGYYRLSSYAVDRAGNAQAVQEYVFSIRSAPSAPPRGTGRLARVYVPLAAMLHAW